MEIETIFILLFIVATAVAITLTALILTPAANMLHFVQGFTWKHALVFGALISATDPIAAYGSFLVAEHFHYSGVIATVSAGMLCSNYGARIGMIRERIPWYWSIILTWGGLCCALSMVLVISLPMDFVYRELLVSMTFGVVILSILVHGLTISPLLRWLGIVHGQQERTQAATPGINR
jgi:NhaP-type Na+/H+ or K+/H+ antiporter